MIAFSLNKDINPQDIINGIAKLIQKEADSTQDCVLVISISKISQVVDYEETRCIEA